MMLESHKGTITIITRVLFVAMPLLLWWFTLLVRRRGGHALRPIAAFQALRGLLGRAVEEGKRVHLSLGRSGVGDEQTAVVATGLNVLRYMADEGAAFGVSPIVTVADPVLMLAAQDVVYRAYQRQGFTARYADTEVQLIAPDPTAYAVGAQDRVNEERVAANVMVGHLGDEYLLLGEAGAQRGLVQVVGSDVLSAQPFMVATSDRALLGEEMFAAGAYLGRHPGHIASLYVQDVLRLLIVVAIVIAAVVKTLAG